MRMRSRWHKRDKPRSLEESAGAVAFNFWQIAAERVRQLEKEGYRIDDPVHYLSCIAEFLAFLGHLFDRRVHGAFNEDERVRLVQALMLKLAQVMEENRRDAKVEAMQPDAFVALINERFAELAQMKLESETDYFSFYRFLSQRIGEIVPPPHNRWVREQVIEVEAPASRELMDRALANLLNI